MSKYYSGVEFKYTFRDYQRQFLDNIQEYLSDDRIHIVAAPGAGKTILALEMCRQIDEKTLVVVPSIAIKEQWIERFTKDFTGTDSKGCISSQLGDGSGEAVLTVITYQMLHSMMRRGDDVPKIITDSGIRTIVLDECHHMRRVWFNSLKKTVSALDGCRLISLTATPPYDNGPEFRNYMDLCGDIDDRITVGQLVGSNCLCPHQDYVYFNLPSKEQSELMKRVNEFSDSLLEEVRGAEQFITAVALNDMIMDPEGNMDGIIRDFDFYVAMCSLLAAVGCSHNANRIEAGFKAPPFDKEKLALILERYLYGKIPEAKIIGDYLSDIRKRLELAGCVKEKHIDLVYSTELSEQILANSGKLDSICEIVEHEYGQLGRKLDMAICTDYIKNEYYAVHDEEEIDEIGVMPIFRKLRYKCPHVDLAVLTGSMIYIPARLDEKLREIAADEYGIKPDEIKIKELGIDFDYSSVEIAENKRKYTVNILTKLFRTGDVQVLIGTIALIGEGWDAPFINSLIIASSVSTYVTSNQVRGRAIRVDKAEPDKVSNIWHLVTMENCGDFYAPGKDYRAVSERFIGFEGINSETDIIETGISRLNVRTGAYTKDEVQDANRRSLARAADRSGTKEAWTRSLADYVPEYYERIPDRIVSKSYHARVGFIRKRRVNKLTASLIRALKQAGIISPGVNSRVEHSDRTGYKVVLTNANTHDQIMFADAVKQQYEVGAKTRYVVEFFGRLYPVPDIMGQKKMLAEIYRKSLGLPFSKLIYVRNAEGKRMLLKSRLAGL